MESKDNIVTVEIRNCNNISEGKVSWEKGKLNIKYGLNGTGKTTIGKAIIASSRSRSEFHSIEYALDTLRPYGTEGDESRNPSIEISEEAGKVAVFNEDYVSSFLFTESGLMSDAFSVFVKPEGYMESISRINERIRALPDTFNEIPELGTLLESLERFLGECGRAKDRIGKSSKFYKAFYDGNKLDSVPEDLSGYSGYLKPDEKLAPWLKWQSDGLLYLSDGNDHCPFCAGAIGGRRDSITRLGAVYNSSAIRPLVEILEVSGSLSLYFSDEAEKELWKIIHNADGFDMDNSFLNRVRLQASGLSNILGRVKYFSYSSIMDPSGVKEVLRNLHIDIREYPCFDSVRTRTVTDAINRSIEGVQELIDELEENVRKLKKQINSRIDANKSFINSFMERSGYRYRVEVSDSDNHDDYSLILRAAGSGSDVDNVMSHLSYGKRNAFALALFAVDIMYQKPDLIIIDDPVSSFDGNKKYALFSMLFSKKKKHEAYSLRGKTVLLFTHEEEIVRDVIKVFAGDFRDISAASFLQTDKDGVLSEEQITEDDVKSFASIMCDVLNRENIPDIVKAVYLRRHFDLREEKSDYAYDMLSSLLHRKKHPERKIGEGWKPLSSDEMKTAERSIRKLMPSFSYAAIFKDLTDENLAKAYKGSSSNYEKLQLFRILIDDKKKWKKELCRKTDYYFINEPFHIENESIFQLDPRKFPTVPQYVIDVCDSYIAKEYIKAPALKLVLDLQV